MGKKINRDEIIRQIQRKIDQCDAYNAKDPNPFAQNRVKSLQSNPCISGKYYLNGIFSSDHFTQSTEEAKKFQTTNRITDYKYTDLVRLDIYYCSKFLVKRLYLRTVFRLTRIKFKN